MARLCQGHEAGVCDFVAHKVQLLAAGEEWTEFIVDGAAKCGIQDAEARGQLTDDILVNGVIVSDFRYHQLQQIGHLGQKFQIIDVLAVLHVQNLHRSPTRRSTAHVRKTYCAERLCLMSACLATISVLHIAFGFEMACIDVFMWSR